MSRITEQISSAIDIADLISESVKLRPSSRGYVGLCPFHQEDTPSFHVYTDTQSYYCFGCQRGGNIFSYVMEKEHVNFYEALQILSDRAGIRLHDKSDRLTGTLSVHDILKLSEQFFGDNLKSSNAAMAYLKKRSLDETDIAAFGLGYAPESWDALTLYLRKHGLSDRAIVDSGLALKSDKGSIYDRFRGRIMFTIKGVTGRTIAFGGRMIAGEGAKYINSPESELYHKRRNLYLLDRARNAIREKKRSILCEGYMDAIRLQKSGFHESVASLGTSLTPEQAELLSRYADTCYICYDSDTAGQNASIRGMYILQSNGLNVKVIHLPEGKDPDEFLLTHSPDEFEALIAGASPLVMAHIEALRPRLNDESTRKSAVRELFSSLETLRASEVLEYKGVLSEATHMLPTEIERIIKPKSELLPESPKHEAVHEGHNEHDDSLECALCALLMNNERFRLRVKPDELNDLIGNSEIRELALSILNEDVNGLTELWLQTGDNWKLSVIERGNVCCAQMVKNNDDEKFAMIKNVLIRDRIDRRIAEIKALPVNERDFRELNMLYLEREKYDR